MLRRGRIGRGARRRRAWPVIGVLACLLTGAPESGTADYDEGLRYFDANDYGSAFEAWKKAEDRGDAKSQHRLAMLYEAGLGTPQNYIRAHTYYNLAGAQGYADARTARDALAAKMTKDELVEARRLASNSTDLSRPTPPDRSTLFEAIVDGDAGSELEARAGGRHDRAVGGDGRRARQLTGGLDQGRRGPEE